MRILLDAINNRLDTVKEKISKLLDIKVEIIQNKAERKNQQSHNGLWDSKKTNKHATGS